MGRSRLDIEGMEIKETREGVRLRLRVKPGARDDAILSAHGGALKVSVKAPPERGRANAAVAALLARTLEVPRARIVLASGHASKDKTVEILGMSAAELRSRLEDPGAPSPVRQHGKRTGRAS